MFITENDNWGIRSTVKELFTIEWKKTRFGYIYERYEVIEFDGVFNQLIPPAYLESKSTVLRHIEEIRKIMKWYLSLGAPSIWVFKKVSDNGISKERMSCKCILIDNNFITHYNSGKLTLPTYQDIEYEKKKWYDNPSYDERKGKSVLVEEEVIQLKLHK